MQSSDILEDDDESLVDDKLEGTGAALGTGGLGSGCIHTHYPCSGNKPARGRCFPCNSAETGQATETVEAPYPHNAAGHGELLSPVQHVQQHGLVEHWSDQDCQQGVVRSDYILAANQSTALAEHGD